MLYAAEHFLAAAVAKHSSPEVEATSATPPQHAAPLEGNADPVSAQLSAAAWVTPSGQASVAVMACATLG